MASLGKNYYVVNHQFGWAVKRENGQHAISTHSIQDKAIKKAIDLAQESRGEVLVQGSDGEWRAKWSYGKDPYPPEG